jgi:methionine-rich copper-binding protein CopC
VGAACLSWALVPGGALAHSELRSSSPKDGARLTQAPAAVTLRFSEPLRKVLRVRVTDARGRNKVVRVQLRGSEQRTVRARLRALVRGRYRVQWVVVAADGFTQAGSFGFRVVRRAGS